MTEDRHQVNSRLALLSQKTRLWNFMQEMGAWQRRHKAERCPGTRELEVNGEPVRIHVWESRKDRAFIVEKDRRFIEWFVYPRDQETIDETIESLIDSLGQALRQQAD